MDWKQLLASITRSVDEELRLRNAFLVTENRILRQQMAGRVPLSDGNRLALAEIGQKLGWKALAEIAIIAKPDTILAWHRKHRAQPCGRSLSVSTGTSSCYLLLQPWLDGLWEDDACEAA